MPYEIFLALRYLRSRGKRRLARVTALLAVCGIAVGVAALIVALALANGFRDEMRDKILEGSAHFTVMRNDGQAMQDYRDVAARITGVQGVRSATGTTYDGAVVIGPKGSGYAVLRGIDGTSPQSIDDIGRTVIAGSVAPLFENQDPKLPNVMVGAELATRTGLQVGERAEIISASPGVSSGSSKRHVRVAGIFRTGLFEYDATWIYLPLETAATFAGGAHAATVISVQVWDIYNVKETAGKVREMLGGSYTIVDWQDANRPLFTALALERRIGVVIIALIILTAALNITTTLILVVMERRRDIAILNAMGAKGKSIMGTYGDFIAQIDNYVAQVNNTLKQLNIDKNTIVIFASDNGSPWAEDDIQVYSHQSNYSRRGQKGDVWDGGHHIALIIQWPDKIKEKFVYPQTVSLIDLMATFSEMTGQAIKDNFGEDGFSFYKVLNERSTASTRDQIVYISSRNMLAVKKDGWKYIDGLGSGGFTEPGLLKPVKGGPLGQLYNVKTDPLEKNNLYMKYPERVKELSDLLSNLTTKGYSNKRGLINNALR